MWGFVNIQMKKVSNHFFLPETQKWIKTRAHIWSLKHNCRIIVKIIDVKLVNL